MTRPSTDRDETSSAPRHWMPPMPHLFIVLEGARPLAGGLRVSLREIDRVLIGRGEARAVERRASRELVVTVPDRKVSGRHVTLQRDGDAWTLEDAGSTNGTFVDRVQVQRCALADESCIGVGYTVLRLRTALPTPDRTPESTSSGDAQAGPLNIATLVPALARELSLLGKVASSKLPVLLLGETGTGKEVIANAIHRSSDRRSGPFVAINCAALSPGLVEAMLFGHVRGAFSGATQSERGFVRAAHGGTLFLDEVADLPNAAQGTLLRVLQEHEVVPVGSTKAAPVDIRVISATHQPLEGMVERGSFRRDLFARLQGFAHRPWPLADRREDLGLLIAELLPRLDLARADSLIISGEAARAIVGYPWPFNIRELVQALSLALQQTDSELLGVSQLTSSIQTNALGSATRAPTTSSGALSLGSSDEALRAELMSRLMAAKGNVAAVARGMEKAPMQVYRWMRRLGIEPKTFR